MPHRYRIASLRRALALIALVLAAGVVAPRALADGQADIQRGLLTEIGRAKLVPFDKSALKGHYPRTSIAAGAVEKIVNKVIETNGSSLGFMLTESAQPSGVTGNAYVDATKGMRGAASPESELATAIMASKKPMMPGDVLGAALKITKGTTGSRPWSATTSSRR